MPVPRNGLHSSVFSLLVACCLPFLACHSEPLSEATLFQEYSDAIVTIRHMGREGREQGVGTGFVMDREGRIITSLHVIGEARRVKVIFSDGAEYEPESIWAWDRNQDLAVLKISRENLTPLPLGQSSNLTTGQKVMALGNPMGLERSVVGGVLSGVRQFTQGPMIQIAIPIEPGNSGGPLFDVQGQVIGVMNMKSTLTPNLGFATPIDGIRPLLERPNSMAWSQWLRLGALDETRWVTGQPAMWSSKVGRVRVDGVGEGFGGRAYCHWVQRPEHQPYQVEVMVRLTDESGAAGIIFGSDGGDTHYGFYPSNSQLRLTRFEGPSVYDWTILDQVRSSHYRKGDWNHLRVVHRPDTIDCYLNDVLVIQSKDRDLVSGQVGITKFRQTGAEFMSFRVREDGFAESEVTHADGLRQEREKALLEAYLMDSGNLPTSGGGGEKWTSEDYRQVAEKLKKGANFFKEKAEQTHRETIAEALQKMFQSPEGSVDLLKAALWIARHDQPSLDASDYIHEVERMALAIQKRWKEPFSQDQKVESIITYLFVENGFHGSFTDYQHASNSYLNKVIEDREGLPITLSVLFMALAEKCGLDCIKPLPLPGHFMVRQQLASGDEQVIDLFEGGRRLSFTEADQMAWERQGVTVDSQQMQIPSKKDIILRMIRNLQIFAGSEAGLEASLPYLDLALALDAFNTSLLLERASTRLRMGLRDDAKKDFETLLELLPADDSAESIRELYNTL